MPLSSRGTGDCEFVTGPLIIFHSQGQVRAISSAGTDAETASVSHAGGNGRWAHASKSVSSTQIPVGQLHTKSSPFEAPSPATVSQIKLSLEQEAVLQRVRQGQNVFFTGSAGS
jgi:hypothetical protein